MHSSLPICLIAIETREWSKYGYMYDGISARLAQNSRACLIISSATQIRYENSVAGSPTQIRYENSVAGSPRTLY